MAQPIHINATFQVSTRRNYFGTELVVLSRTEYIDSRCTRLWSGEGRNIWEALSSVVYNACDAGWIER